MLNNNVGELKDELDEAKHNLDEFDELKDKLDDLKRKIDKLDEMKDELDELSVKFDELDELKDELDKLNNKFGELDKLKNELDELKDYDGPNTLMLQPKCYISGLKVKCLLVLEKKGSHAVLTLRTITKGSEHMFRKSLGMHIGIILRPKLEFETENAGPDCPRKNEVKSFGHLSSPSRKTRLGSLHSEKMEF